MLYALEEHQPQLENKDNTWVADSADVIGRVLLKSESSIWFGAVLRGDNELITIGRCSNVQDLTVFHTEHSPTIVGEYCTIGHRAIIHGCTIGNHCLIGMGATIMNDAVINDYCIVGAGSLVTEGKTFPPRSLIIGSPARVLRMLTDAEIESITSTALHYHDNAMRFKNGLKTL